MLAGREHLIYLPPYEAVYVDIAKVASSSIKATLASLLDLGDPTDNPHLIDFPHPRALPSGADQNPSLFPDLFTFAFVRNPWDRLVSCYRDKILGEAPDFTGFADNGVAHCLAKFDAFKAQMSFEEFAKAVAAIPDAAADEHFRSQADYVTNTRAELAVDFLGRFETLERDFDKVAGRLGFPAETQLPRLQAAGSGRLAGASKDFRTFYNPETTALVAQRYARDIHLFRYRPDSVH